MNWQEESLIANTLSLLRVEITGCRSNLLQHGDEFQDCREHAAVLALKNDWHRIPSMHADLLSGVATYWLELFKAQPDLDVVFVPIGQGSGICAAAAAKQALGLKTKIIG